MRNQLRYDAKPDFTSDISLLVTSEGRGQPLDTLKVRAQLAKPGQYRNTWDIATQTVRREGFLALYKGMASPLVGIAGVNALLFASFNQAKRIVSPYPVLSIPQIALAGALGGAVNSILASPVELFKIRMQGAKARIEEVVA